MLPTPTDPSVRLLRFGVFELDLDSGELKKRGATVRLHDKPFRVLAALVQHPGQVVTRDQLRERLWPGDTFVDFDGNLNAAVRKVREALDDSAGSPRFVETLPKRGYRFIAPVEVVHDPATTPPADPAEAPAVRRGRAGWRWALGATVVALLAVTASVFAWRRDRTAPPVVSDRAMLAVLPFANLDGDPSRDYFSDGLTEELIAQLGRLQPDRLGVIARISAMTYKSTDKTVATIGEELGVDYVLEGSVRSSDDRLRITAQLIRVDDQTHSWAETYDVELGDVLRVQGDVAVRVAHELALELLPDQPLARARAGTRVTDAYRSYLQGRFNMNRFDAEGYRRAIAHFEHALQLDPDYVAAWSSLAATHNLRAFVGEVTVFEAFAAARGAADEALERDPASAEALAARAFVRLYHDYDLVGADEDFRHAVQLDPNQAVIWHWRAGALAALERHDDAIAAVRRAVELDPVSSSVISDLGWYYLYADRWDEGRRECQRVLDREAYGWARACVLQAWRSAGQLEPLIAAEREALGPNPPAAHTALFKAASSSEVVAALAAFRADRRLREDPEPDDAWAAMLLGDAGRLDEAFATLERAFAQRDPWLVFLKVEPRFDALADDPRYDALARRIGLPPAMS